MAKTNYDAALLQDIQDNCVQREMLHAERIKMCDAIEKMFLVLWEDEKPDITGKDWIKLTISPEARNKALGAIRLMTAADPKFSVPFDKNNQKAKDTSSLLEKAAAAMWLVSGRIRQNPVHYDAVTSAVLWAEMHIGVNATADLLEHAKGSSKASQMRFEKIAAQTPYMFEVYDPRTGFPDFDDYGLSSFYRKVSMKSGKVLDAWGELALKSGLTATKRFEDVEYCDYWDNEWHAVWIKGSGEPLLFAQHNLPCIPIVAQITDGSFLHKNEESKRQPFLYGLWKSGLWKRQNLALTVIYSTMFALASNPTFIEKVQDENRDLKVDYSVPGGKIKMLVNEDFYALAKNIIDPSIVQGLELAQKMIEESTIYSQALGQELGGNAPYSLYALVNQAGRLPLVTLQRRGSWAIAKAVELAFTMMKDVGGKNKVDGKDKLIEVVGKDIPDNLIIEAKLDIDLPQDKKQMITMALQGIAAKFFSKEFGRREFAGIEQSDEMSEAIWAEDLAELELQKDFQIQLAKVQAEIQASIPQPGQPQGQPQGMPPGQPQGIPQGGQQQGIPPELMQQLAGQQGASSGNPMTEPVPMGEGM
jgi:hypothetical protein